ncbi:MAG: glycosyltransferase family 2 protein [Acidobacteriota bacterium]|nr:glycosyltransferase family 2 protein [Acidobacteriota bacterium]
MIAVVIPAYRAGKRILGVLSGIGEECRAIYVIDDACPEGTGRHVESACRDPRVRVIRNENNLGVGGATMVGYRHAVSEGAEIVVKLDADGQMDPRLIPRLVQPIVDGLADYTKGNRFYDLDGLGTMPRIRLVGSSLMSFASKASSGYWNLFDPANGFTAIHAAVVKQLPFDKISRRWFFESDMLFRLGTLRAVVSDVPMPAVYGDEESNVVIRRVVGEFGWKHVENTIKRVFYNYYLRNFNIASIEIVLAIAFLAFGTWFGVTRWIHGSQIGVASTSGTVMLAALPVIVGVQLLLASLSYDLQNIPRDVLHRRLVPRSPRS